MYKTIVESRKLKIKQKINFFHFSLIIHDMCLMIFKHRYKKSLHFSYGRLFLLLLLWLSYNSIIALSIQYEQK